VRWLASFQDGAGHSSGWTESLNRLYRPLPLYEISQDGKSQCI